MTITFLSDTPDFEAGTGLEPISVAGLGGPDTLLGAVVSGNSLFGNTGDDSLASRATSDTLNGGQGGDTLVSTGGSLLSGDAGDDSIVGIAGGTTFLASGNSGGGDTLYGGDGDDTIISFGDSVVNGNAGNDVITAGDSDDTINGGAGNDTIGVGSWSALAFGDRGNDFLFTANDPNVAATLSGAEGDDTVQVWGNSRGFGGSGADVLSAFGNATINGGQDGDTLSGSGSVVISGDLGDDSLAANGSGVSIFGGGGADTVAVNAGDGVSVDAGSGADVVNVGSGVTGGFTISPGAGDDTITFAGSLAPSASNVVDLTSGGNNLVSSQGGLNITAGTGADTITVGPNDTISGVGPATVLVGAGSTAGVVISSGSSATSIAGGTGADNLTGGDGADTIEGLGSGDVLTGGAGADVFLYQGANLGAVSAVSDNRVRSTFAIATASFVFSEAATIITNNNNNGTLAVGGTSFVITNAGLADNAPTTGPVTLNFSDLTSGAQFGDTAQTPAVASPLTAVGQVGTIADALVGGLVGFTATGTNITFLGAAGTGALAPSPGFGYSAAGVDVITDFTPTVDQLRLQSSLFGGLLNANTGPDLQVTSTGTAGAANENGLFYDQRTGYLYFRQGVVGTEAVYAIDNLTFTGTVASAVAVAGGNAGVGVTAGQPAIDGGGAALAAALPNVAPAVTPADGIVFNATVAEIVFSDGAGGATGPGVPNAVLPVPFVQLLNAGAPVTGLSGNDIVIF